MRRWLVLFAVLALVAPAQGAETMEDARDLVYVLSAPDAVDDNTGPCWTVGCQSPGDNNRENDIILTEVTDDQDTLVIRVSIQTCEFGVDSGFAFVNIEFAGALAGYEGTVAFDNGCTDPRAIEIDSLTATSDPDELLPGIRVAADPAANQVYIMADYADLGLSDGDTITFQDIMTGRQFSDPGRYTFRLDQATAPDFKVGSGKEANLPVEPSPIIGYEELVVNNFTRNFTAATETLWLNWTPSAQQGQLFVGAQGDGAAIIDFMQANGTTFFRYDGSGQLATEVNATAPWVVMISLDGFTGLVEFHFQPDAAAPPYTPPAAPQEPVVDDEPPTAIPENGNQTSDDAPAVGEESPGLALWAVLGMLAIAVRRQR